MRSSPLARLACAIVIATCTCISAARADGDDTSGATRAALHKTIAKGDTPAQLVAFYKARDFKPAWSGDDTALAHGEEARNALAHADTQGLRNEDYAWWTHWPEPPSDARDAALYDIALTRSMLLYAWDVHVGRFKPAAVYKDLQLPPQSFDTVHLLNRALAKDSLDSFLEHLSPSDKGYTALVEALGRYREIAADGGWPVVSASTKSALAKRLAIEDPELAKDGDDPDDDDVAAALKRYESRNGLPDDPKPDPAVIASLNVPVQSRIAAIVVNLERRRWMPKLLEDRYIAVNVPDQSLDFVHDGDSVLHSKVVVGTPATPTPILRTEVKAVVVNPPWDIPDFIAAKSLLPHLKKDSNYLATRNIVLVDGPTDDPYGTKIDWRKVTAKTIPYQIQQPPGGDNALGNVMLDMPNDFDVYIHDTPHKELFELPVREKSNGCIRVEEIKALTSLLLTDDPKDDLDRLNTRIDAGETLHLVLDDPMPVYLVYWTAIPSADGTIGFRPDSYGRDRKLAKLFETAEPAATVKPVRVSAREDRSSVD